MRKFILILFILVIAVLAWLFFAKRNRDNESHRDKAIAVSKHSSAFNQSVNNALSAYYDLTESFVNWDSVTSKVRAKTVKEKLDSLRLEELKKDSSGISETAQSFIADAKANLDSIQSQSTLTDQRHSLNNLSQNLYDFLRSVKYDQSKLYLQECPMAFNETESGIWLSKAEAIRNPYMGLHHPHYGKGMIDCGEIKDTLNFMRKK